MIDCLFICLKSESHSKQNSCTWQETQETKSIENSELLDRVKFCLKEDEIEHFTEDEVFEFMCGKKWSDTDEVIKTFVISHCQPFVEVNISEEVNVLN